MFSHVSCEAKATENIRSSRKHDYKVTQILFWRCFPIIILDLLTMFNQNSRASSHVDRSVDKRIIKSAFSKNWNEHNRAELNKRDSGRRGVYALKTTLWYIYILDPDKNKRLKAWRASSIALLYIGWRVMSEPRMTSAVYYEFKCLNIISLNWRFAATVM